MIAGLHMAMMTAMVIFVLKLVRLPRWAQVILSIVLLITYAILTGASVPVLGAAFMAIRCFISIHRGMDRHYSFSNMAFWHLYSGGLDR